MSQFSRFLCSGSFTGSNFQTDWCLCPRPSAAQSHQEGPLSQAAELLPLLQPVAPRQALPARLHQPEGQAAAALLQRLHQPDVQRLHRPQLLPGGWRAAAAAQEPGQRSDMPAPRASAVIPAGFQSLSAFWNSNSGSCRYQCKCELLIQGGIKGCALQTLKILPSVFGHVYSPNSLVWLAIEIRQNRQVTF